VLGVNQSFASLGRILGPFVGSLVFWQESSRVLPFAVAVLTLLVVLGFLPQVTRGDSAAGAAGSRPEAG
jgi:hypothetical protein